MSARTTSSLASVPSRSTAELLNTQREGDGHVYTITKNNDVVMYSESEDDPEQAMQFMQSAETARAMEEDGVDRSTVKVYPLDRDLNLS
jgi:hypothetical protein